MPTIGDSAENKRTFSIMHKPQLQYGGRAAVPSPTPLFETRYREQQARVIPDCSERPR
jgi:hypothetical protein